MAQRNTLIILIAALFAAGCFSPRAREPYPPPARLRAATSERFDFVDSFLQGYWCDAEQLFTRSVEGYLRQDDFCEAAANYVLAWKLTSYIDRPDGTLLEKAEQLKRTGVPCPDVSPYDPYQPAAAATPEERSYLALLRQDRFDQLYATLLDQEDPLFRSVYARKGARAAMKSGNMKKAGEMVELARKTDAAQGWTVFLRLDWSLAEALATDPVQRARIKDRIQVLQNLIQPCQPRFAH